MTELLQIFKSDKVRGSRAVIEIIDPLSDGDWDARVTTREDHTIFHRSAWARVLADTYGHRPNYLRFLIDSREVALVPLMEVRSFLTGRRGISLPFSDFASPLWTEIGQADEVYKGMMDFARDRKWDHLEIRGGSVKPPGARPFHNYDGHQLDLRQGIEMIWRGLDSSVRRAIRKAECSGIEVTTDRSLEAMKSFYELHGRTRRRHGLPPQPSRFFEAIARNLIGQGLGEIVLARCAGIPIAGAVFFHSGRSAIYKFGASDSEYWPSRPNHLIIWTAIRELVKIGCRELHFGRTSNDDLGLVRFKLSWGAVSTPLPYYRHDSKDMNWLVSDLHPAGRHTEIFGRLPIALNRLAGRLIYPHLD